MSPEDFIRESIILYQDSKVALFDNKKIHRGRSRSVSSAIEDLFASYLVRQNSNIENIYLDQPINVPGVVRCFIPDIVVVKEGKITAFFDLKTNLGYMRDGLSNLCKKDSLLIKSLRGRSCHFRDGITKKKIEIKISDNAIYDIVVLSGANIGKELLNKQLGQTKKYKKLSAVHVLSNGVYLGEYNISKTEIYSRVKVNNHEFDNIISRLS